MNYIKQQTVRVIALLALFSVWSWAFAATNANTISQVAYNVLTPQQTQVIFTLNGPLKKLESFSTDSPSRIILDFWGDYFYRGFVGRFR